MGLTRAGHILLRGRYLLPGETPRAMFRRVARAVGTIEEEHFFRLMDDLRFLPNSPTLMNAGGGGAQLSACFVLPVGDSIESIFRALNHMALIHKSGGGTGFSFSHIRPAGDCVGNTAGVASGPIPFIRVFDEATSALKQGGKRRGANMGVLASSHPDIIAFIHAKQEGGLQNFNLSVGFDGTFFSALSRDSDYDLVNPRDGAVWASVPARAIWKDLTVAAWQCGDPGILFLDRINETNTMPGLGSIEATNPCGEQPLLPYESCNLGSINLAACLSRDGIDYGLLSEVIGRAVRFLDRVIDINAYPVPEIREATLRTRKIGLGVMGLADALILLEIPYQSGEGLSTTGAVMRFLQDEAHAASRELAEKNGSFPEIGLSTWAGPMRNATVTTIAPTGSLHIIAGTSSGIEPLFSLAPTRSINGQIISSVHPSVERLIAPLPGGHSMIEEILRTGSVQHLPVGDDTRELLRTAAEIEPEFHVRMQAHVQRYIDNAVSKTVNLPEDATTDDISRTFLLARELGCKGITVYRYNSRTDQVLSRGCDTCRVDSFAG